MSKIEELEKELEEIIDFIQHIKLVASTAGSVSIMEQNIPILNLKKYKIFKLIEEIKNERKD